MRQTDRDLPNWWKIRLDTIESLSTWAQGGKPPEYPMEVFLEVSNVCDLKCAMCPTFSALSPSRFYSIKEQERGLLDIDQLKPNLDEILKRAIYVHCFGYGEPTLHDDFPGLLEYLSRYRVMIDFFTNGMHLDATLCDALVEYQVFSITISASGSNKESYENLYLGGQFEKLLSGLKQLQSSKSAAERLYPRIQINSIAFDHHVEQLPSFIDLMAEHGAEVIHLKSLQTFETTKELRGHRSILRPWLEGSILKEAQRHADKHGITLSCDQYLRSEVDTEKAWQEARGDISATLPLSNIPLTARQIKPSKPPIGYQNKTTINAMHLSAEEIRNALALSEYKTSNGQFYCFEPFKTIYIQRSGHIKPCCFSDNSGPSLGNIMETDGIQIWKGRAFEEIRQSILNQHYPQSLCAHCLKEGYGPSQHDIPNQLFQYNTWLETAWGYSIPSLLPTTILSNQDIIARWRESEQIAKQENQLLHEIRRLTPFGIPQTLIEGNVDGVIDSMLHGWIHSPKHSRLRLSVTISIDGIPWKTLKSDQYREDLANSRKGDGSNAFMVELTEKQANSLIEVWLTHTEFLIGRIESTNKEPIAPKELVDKNKDSNIHFLPNSPTTFPLHYNQGIHEREIFRYFSAIAEHRTSAPPFLEEQRPDTILAIPFTNRSGSNFLAETLAATGLVTRASESFNYDAVIETCTHRNLTDLASYLTYLIPASIAPPFFAVKLSWDQLFFLTRVGIIPYYWPKIRFAWIMRDDLIAQSLSHIVAERSNSWKGSYPKDLLQRILHSITSDDLVRKVEEITFAHRQFLTYFSLYGIKPAIINYDELIANPESEAHSILEQLQMIPKVWKWNFKDSAIEIKRQRTREMEYFIAKTKANFRFDPSKFDIQ